MFQFPIGVFNYVETGGGGAEDFTFTVDTTKAGSASDTILLPYSGGNTTYWGDGSDSTSNTHIYSSGGEYEIHIEGTVTGWKFDNGGDKLKMLDVKSWDTLTLDQNSVFYGCANMTVSATNQFTLTSNMINMFRGCSSITSLDLSDLSVGSTIQECFRDCSSLSSLNVSGWTTTSVGSAYNAFRSCSSLTSLDFSDWDTSSFTNMSTMLGFCGSLASVTWGTFDISSVTSISNFLVSVTLDTTDYSDLLVNFASQTVNSGLSFHGGNSKYNSAGGTARASLIADDSWSITDGGAE